MAALPLRPVARKQIESFSYRTAMNRPFGIVMPLGPSALEVERLRDTVESLEHFERGNYHLVIADDAPQDRGLRAVLGGLDSSRFTIIKNPRDGRGDGWAAGCTAGLLAGLKVLAMREVEFALKLDADALVIRPFAAQVQAKFAGSPTLGMVGSRYFFDAPGPERDWIHDNVALTLEKLKRPFAIWRQSRVSNWPVVQMAWWGEHRAIRDIIRGAYANGFKVGDHCQGGVYALSRECLLAFDRRGYLDRPLRWLPTSMPEDHTAALLVQAAGLRFCDFGGEGEPFASHWRGLSAAPEVLLKRGHALVHSVKDHGGLKEQEIRAYFKTARQNLALPPG